MQLATKTLRDYQEKLVFNVCRATDNVLVEQPTGSGKTVQIVTLVAMHLGKRFSHAVIAAPQEQIEQGFVRRDYGSVAFPERRGVAVPSIQVPKQTILGARDSKVGSVKRVLQYLLQPGPLDHAFACTHAALNRITADDLPDDLTGKALFIDEAHHASADGLSQIVTLWRERGGQLFFFTATPYRGDGRPVKLDGMRTYRRSLAEHMAEGFAPRNLDSEIVALGSPGEVITPAIWTGEEAPPDIQKFVSAISRRWLDDGKPKAIVRVPPMREGKSGQMVEQLMQSLPASGARVLDATGTGAADKQRFLAGLKAEQQQTFATSTFDVMIGIQRVLEGTDWPLCSAVYCVGMPGSLNTVVQFLGRAMRLKGFDYPADQRDRAKLVFFVPCGGGAALTDLSIDHSRHALLTCCFLADHEVGQEWIVTQEVRRGIEAALGPRADNPAAADAENDADEPLDPVVRAEIELVMATVREEILSTGEELAVGKLVQVAAKTRPDFLEADLHRVATELLAMQPESAIAVGEAIRREMPKQLRIHPTVKKALDAVFAIVVQEFRSVTLEDSAVLESVGRQVHGVTGGQMREFAQRLRDAAPRRLTVEQILAWADKYHDETRDWPKIDSGPILDAQGEVWANVDAALRAGGRGLPGGFSLPRLLADHRRVPYSMGAPLLSVDEILSWADAHRQRTGEWPKSDSGSVEGYPREKWANINAALIGGTRGLPGGSSLPKLLAEKRGVRNLMSLPNHTIDEILAWADAHHNATAQWPQVLSGPVTAAPDETWQGINMLLTAGGRGLLGGSSLAKLLAEKRDVRNTQGLPDLKKEQVILWADAYRQRTGKWPSRNAGAVDGAPSDTWGNIDAALKQGSRGFPGRSTLAKFLAEHCGARVRLNPPDLTTGSILEWIDSYHRSTGKWPNHLSGSVEEALGETWAAVNWALVNGKRGLPGGSSLAKLLQEHRGARNHLNLPKLSEDGILSWAQVHLERTGEWPKRSSGEVDGVPDEAWSRIDTALREGLRGLPGGSSLAKLRAEFQEIQQSEQ